MTLELHVQEPALPREQRIREVFEANGAAMPILALARACVTAGVWTQEELDALALAKVREDCRRALRVKDAAGLPKISQTAETDSDGQPVWKARQLWLFADYEVNIRQHIEQRDEGHLIAVRLATECQVRYGVAVPIPTLPDA